jgi:glycosyltransferase involved in cell wall biosynthesis
MSVNFSGDDAPEWSEANGSAPGLLCVANFPANTGYAWDFIEGIYRGLAEELAQRGVRTWVAYPSMRTPPATLAGSAARAVELPVELGRPRDLLALLRFVRRNNIRVVYLTDRAVWHPGYVLLRLAGVRHIVVHDHTSGERTAPRGGKRLAKLALSRVPGMLADEAIGVSDYVARRLREVALMPAERTHRVWNSLERMGPEPRARIDLRARFGLEEDRLVVVCACRATAAKGVVHLLRAFDRVDPGIGARLPVLIYFGDGPDLEQLKRVGSELGARDRVIFAGYRDDAAALSGGADVCVVPSVWAEAFGLAALEPMASGVPVIASRVGGIPEIVVDGETGVLVTAGDEAALATALGRLLSDAGERQRLGQAGATRARRHFSREVALAPLLEIIASGFAVVDHVADSRNRNALEAV